jgi:hypothetical protein
MLMSSKLWGESKGRKETSLDRLPTVFQAEVHVTKHMQ